MTERRWSQDWGQPARPRTLRLQCESCRRNLADVTRPDREGALVVTARPNVDQREYLAPDTDGPTYTWKCRCGRSPSVRYERLRQAWREARPSGSDQRVVTVLVRGGA